MPSKIPFRIFVALLFILGVAAIAERHINGEIPWLPGQTYSTWMIEAKVEFIAQGDAVNASFATPSTQRNYTVLNQTAASPGYGLSFIGNRAQWTIRNAEGKQELFYKVNVLANDIALDVDSKQKVAVNKVSWLEPYDIAAEQLVNSAMEKSADAFSYSRELLKLLTGDDLGQNAKLMLQDNKKTTLFVTLLNQANIPALLVKGLYLEDGRRQQKLQPFVLVYGDDETRLIDVNQGKDADTTNLLLWELNGKPTLDLIGGSNSRVSFSIIQQTQPVLQVLEEKFSSTNLSNFSIYSLPLEEQALFKGILLIPLGVLIVVLMRILIGLRTSGTFMPVLIAMAFVQTSLGTGLIGFTLIVGVGLVIRSYLSKLNLLLVSRISVVIITVIAIIGLFSILSYKIGLTEGLKITFFPMIILSWTIERMSILWEEEGAKEVFVQGGGSLFVAVLVYLTISNEVLRYWAFNFLGLQLIIMAVVLMLGTYTGYRLLELRRFKDMQGD
jgi:hypothetical protein